MPTALEKYYQSKKAGPVPDEILQEKLAQEVLGRQILKKHSPGFFVKLLDILDRPGNATRALLVGKLGGLKGLIPFAQVLEDLTGLDIAMNEDELVRGTEVIEKFFGKQKQVKGKIDMVDALGLVVEIVADPLWLVGGVGLTKVGKARKLVGSALGRGGIDDVAKIMSSINKAKQGQVISGFASKKLANAIRTVAKAKGTPHLKSLSWAKQVARGERATLSILGRPVVKGQKLVAKAEKLANIVRTGPIGKTFLQPAKHTTIEHSDLFLRFKSIQNARKYQEAKVLSRFQKAQAGFQTDIAKATGLGMKDVGELGSRYVEVQGAIKAIKKKIANYKRLGWQTKTELAQAKHGRFIDELNAIKKAAGPDNFNKLRHLARQSRITKKWEKELARLGVPLKNTVEEIGYTHRIAEAKYLKEAPYFRAEVPRKSLEGITQASVGKPRSEVLSKMLRPEIDAKYAKPLGLKRVYEQDLLASLAQGQRQFTNRATAAEFIQDAVAKYARPLEGGTLPGYYSMDDIIKKLHAADVPIPNNLRAGQQLPSDIANAIFKNLEVTVQQEDLVTGFWKMHEGAQKIMKGAFTVPFPAFHGRNAFSNKVLNWLDGTWKPQAYVDSLRLQKAAYETRRIMKKTGKSFKAVAPTVDGPTVSGMKWYEAFDLADRNGVLGWTIGKFDPEEVAGGMFTAPQKGTKKLLTGGDLITKGGRYVGTTIEDHDRLAHFLDKLTDGMNPQDAAASAREALFDYSDLSAFEKKWMRNRIAFFYTFARKNLDKQTRVLFQQPAKQALFSHMAGGSPTMQGEAKNYPDYWNERLTIPTPFMDKQGAKQVITGAGLPIEEAFGPLGGPGTGIVNRGRRILSRTMSRLNPMILKPIELATGHQMYFDKPITDYGRFFEQSLPTARATGTLRSLHESPATPGSKALGLTTGIRYRPLEPLKQAEYHKRNVAKQFLQGKAPEYKRFFKPKDTEVDPKIDLALQMQR